MPLGFFASERRRRQGLDEASAPSFERHVIGCTLCRSECHAHANLVAFPPDALRGRASNAALRAEVVTGGAKKAACLHQQDCPEGPMQCELFGEEKTQYIEEKNAETKRKRHPWAWLLKRVFAVEVLVCVHCAGKLRLVEIATEAAAIKRTIGDERRRRGEPVSEMEAVGESAA